MSIAQLRPTQQGGKIRETLPHLFFSSQFSKPLSRYFLIRRTAPLWRCPVIPLIYFSIHKTYFLSHIHTLFLAVSIRVYIIPKKAVTAISSSFAKKNSEPTSLFKKKEEKNPVSKRGGLLCEFTVCGVEHHGGERAMASELLDPPTSEFVYHNFLAV